MEQEENGASGTIAKIKSQGSHKSSKDGRKNLLVGLLSIPPGCCLVLQSPST